MTKIMLRKRFLEFKKNICQNERNGYSLEVNFSLLKRGVPTLIYAKDKMCRKGKLKSGRKKIKCFSLKNVVVTLYSFIEKP